MTIPVFIDSCAWNYLFKHGIDLTRELPREEFALFMPREVEIEIGNIPDDGKDSEGKNRVDKRPLKSYIKNSIEANRVRTTSVFGFASLEPDGSLSKIQTFGGFNQGTFQSEHDRAWYASEVVKQHFPGNKIQNSGLGKNQADASLAVRSFSSIILTDERKGKAGPLSIAAEQGGHIVYLRDEVETSRLSLRAYLCKLLLSLPPLATADLVG
jgi:hypothetical protein